jgi:hypothetical protein
MAARVANPELIEPLEQVIAAVAECRRQEIEAMDRLIPTSARGHL